MLNSLCFFLSFFFFRDTAAPDIYTLSLHDALPILVRVEEGDVLDEIGDRPGRVEVGEQEAAAATDRKSTRLNSSHRCISYAVFCLKKKNWPEPTPTKAARR